MKWRVESNQERMRESVFVSGREKGCNCAQGQGKGNECRSG